MNPTVTYLNELKYNVISKGAFLKETYFSDKYMKGDKEQFLA